MSFFNSLQQYVTSGVAGLGLSPRRFSLSRQESAEPTTPAIQHPEKRDSTAHTTQQHPHHGKLKILHITSRTINIYLYYI